MSRRPSSWAIVPIAIVVVLAGAWYLRGLLGARSLRPSWERSHGTEAALHARFPARPANDTALEVERLGWPLGFDLRTIGTPRAG